MNEFTYVVKELWRGKSITRAFLNLRLAQEELRGKTIDVGGGAGEKYLAFMNRRDGTEFVTFDLKAGAATDFETDQLPAADGAYDTVLFLNVMEHIFNYQHIADEVVRITKPGGQLIGFVPFLMWYHPDHSDFFRYTHEALEKIFAQPSITELKVEPIARGPFIASLQIRQFSYPKPLRVLAFVYAYVLDRAYLALKKPEGNTSRYVLGYVFIAKC